MLPELVIGHLHLPSYATFVLLGVAAAALIGRRERARLGLAHDRRLRWVQLGALLGAVVGSKVGMLLFDPATLAGGLDLSGKTVMGGIAGGYVGVELTKKCVGVTYSTGDGWAIALPVAQALGRVGCFLHGCCFGKPSQAAWTSALGARHPVALYEAAGDLALAAVLFAYRKKPRVPGHLFKAYVVGYAMLRFLLEPLRGDGALRWGPLSSVQWFCLVLGGWMLMQMRERRVVVPGAAT